MLWIFVAMIVLGALGVLAAHRLNPVLIKMSNGKLLDSEVSELRSAWRAWKALLLFSIATAFIGTAGLIALLIRALESAK